MFMEGCMCYKVPEALDICEFGASCFFFSQRKPSGKESGWSMEISRSIVFWSLWYTHVWSLRLASGVNGGLQGSRVPGTRPGTVCEDSSEICQETFNSSWFSNTKSWSRCSEIFCSHPGEMAVSPQFWKLIQHRFQSHWQCPRVSTKDGGEKSFSSCLLPTARKNSS